MPPGTAPPPHLQEVRRFRNIFRGQSVAPFPWSNLTGTMLLSGKTGFPVTAE